MTDLVRMAHSLRDPRAEAAGPTPQHWAAALEKEVELLFSRGETGIMDDLARRFEKALIVRALNHTGGRRIEAAHLLGLGRNTLTRKIQELGISADKKSD